MKANKYHRGKSALEMASIPGRIEMANFLRKDASGNKIYDWQNKQIAVLNMQEMGKIISLYIGGIFSGWGNKVEKFPHLNSSSPKEIVITRKKDNYGEQFNIAIYDKSNSKVKNNVYININRDELLPIIFYFCFSIFAQIANVNKFDSKKVKGIKGYDTLMISKDAKIGEVVITNGEKYRITDIEWGNMEPIYTLSSCYAILKFPDGKARNIDLDLSAISVGEKIILNKTPFTLVQKGFDNDNKSWLGVLENVI